MGRETQPLQKLLVVEDSPEFQLLTARALSTRFSISFAANAATAIQRCKQTAFDAILLDITLPDADGFHVCAEIRSMPGYESIPLLFLTGRREVSDKVLGFSLGADDYILKPFDPKELVARLDARIRRVKGLQEVDTMLTINNLSLNLSRQSAAIVDAGVTEKLNLTPLEFRLLLFLAKSEGRVLSRFQLLEAVWNLKEDISDRTVDRHVSSLRKKLTRFGGKLSAVYSSGYVLSRST